MSADNIIIPKLSNEQNPTCCFYLYNNSLFLAQVFFALIGLSFSAAMLLSGNDPSIYLPVMTAILGWWFPSPLNHKFETPSNIREARNILSRTLNV